MAGNSSPSCRSLLAGERECGRTDWAPNRLQAGSYIPTKPQVIATVLVALLLAGCTSIPAPTQPAAPVAPAALAAPAAPSASVAPAVPVVPAKPATLLGSEERSAMFDDFTAFVVAVDGQAIAAGRQGWNTPLSLPPGPHRLKVAFNRGVFAAEAELSLPARSGAAYRLKFATDAEVFGKNSYCEFWIVDTATGERVTAPHRTALNRVGPAK